MWQLLLAARAHASCPCRDYYKVMCERKDQDMRSLERALQQQLADAGQKSAHLGERELVLASEQVRVQPEAFAQNSADCPYQATLPHHIPGEAWPGCLWAGALLLI